MKVRERERERECLMCNAIFEYAYLILCKYNAKLHTYVSNIRMREIISVYDRMVVVIVIVVVSGEAISPFTDISFM